MWNKNNVLEVIAQFKIQPGQAFYAYDLHNCIQRAYFIKDSFKEWNLLYSIKANPNPKILKKFIDSNMGVDAASAQEVALARKLGCLKENIFYSSPGKTWDDLKSCYEKCVLIADSINEIKRIIKLSKDTGKHIGIGIRINLSNPIISGKAFEIMGGISSKFGLSFSEIELIVEMCKKSLVEIVGIHIYFGSQILDESVIINNFVKIASCALELNDITPLKFVTFGGGFGIPYYDYQRELDILTIINNDLLKNKIDLLKSKDIKCQLELGRYLVANSGIFCTSVEDIKTSMGVKYVVLSSGMNAFIRPIFTKEFHKLNICKSVDQQPTKVTVVGNLCTPIDQYYENYMLENPEIGDWVWFENAGAYGYSMSMLNFISKKKPLEIVVDEVKS